MAGGPFEELRSAIDPAGGLPPAQTGAALRQVDAALRVLLGATWLVLAFRAGAPVPAMALAMLGALSLFGIAPIVVATLGSLLAGWIAARSWGIGAAAALLAIGALRLRIHAGGAGRWLREIRRLEARRAAALVATGLALARSRSEAGDHYERAGRVRGELAALGAAPSAATESLRGVAERLGRALASFPALRDRLERTAVRWSE